MTQLSFRMSSINIDKDVTFVENSNSLLYGVKILKGKYKDVVYCYGEVKLKENPEKGECTLSFSYQIQKAPKELEENSEFVNYIGDVLKELIAENKTYDKSAKDNT